MLSEAVDCEMKFADDVLGGGITGMSFLIHANTFSLLLISRLQQLELNQYTAQKPV